LHPPDELLDWLYGLKGPSLKWDLETAQALVALCGRPDRAFRSLHVAGTNGKGSVAAMAESIARAAGIPSGLYTSPHLVRPEERIRVGGEEISGPALREWIGRLRPLAEEGVQSGALPRFPSFFEMMTAAAFLAFAEQRVRFAAIECGLGGRLDATNVVTPLAAVVTTVALDHVAILGPTRTEIAREKAGIVKPGIPVLMGWLTEDARAEVVARARAVGAPLHEAARELVVEVEPGPSGRFAVTTPERTYRGLDCALAGAHQRRNAALAIRAIELCRARGLAIPPQAIAEGLARVRWPGRMERIARPGAPPVLLDAAHNPEGAEALAAHLAAADRAVDGGGTRRPRIAVFGSTEGRDPLDVVAPLAPLVDAWVVTRPAIDKALDPAVLATALEARGAAVEVVCDPARALARAEALAAGGEVLVTGSLYLVGDARRVLLGLFGPGHPPRETLLPRAAEPARRDGR
jgi:dihydrofolate synthase/folylpolyglutamate synthase